jgi:hypothetical protein
LNLHPFQLQHGTRQPGERDERRLGRKLAPLNHETRQLGERHKRRLVSLRQERQLPLACEITSHGHHVERANAALDHRGWNR